MRVAVAAYGSMEVSTPAKPFSKGLSPAKMVVDAVAFPVRKVGRVFHSRPDTGITVKGRKLKGQGCVAFRRLVPPTRSRATGTARGLVVSRGVASARSVPGSTAVAGLATSQAGIVAGSAEPRVVVSRIRST